MALKDRKITEAGIADHGVVSAPDRLRGTAAENKKVFDKLVRAVVAEKVNGIVDDLTSTEEGASGAAQLGISQIEGVKAVNVQEALQALRTDPAVAAVKAQQAAEEALKAAAEAQSVAEETAEKAKTDAATALKELTQTAEEKVDEVSQLVTSAKSWAVGGTESREGEEEDNAKYWSEQARREIEAALEDFEGVASFNGRDGVVMPQSGDYTAAMVGAVPVSRTVNGTPLSEDIVIPEGVQMELLWENGNLNSDFPAQSFTLEKAKNHKKFVVWFIYQKGTSTSTCAAVMVEVGKNAFSTVGSNINFARLMGVSTEGKFTFYDNRYYNSYASSPTTVDNGYNIPYKIYGISGIDEEVSA